MTMSERWRPVLGYEGLYEVSSAGRVRSLPHVTTARRGYRMRFPGKTLSLVMLPNGRFTVSLYRSGKKRVAPVHVLVAEAFHGRRPEGAFCLHKNGVETDNRAENLRWGTSSENAFDQVAHGVHVQARKTHCPSGHEYTDENTMHSRGRRRCRECGRIEVRARRARQRLEVRKWELEK